MGAIRNLVDELRRRGLVVHEWSGWDGRGNERISQIDPKGAIIHHTGSGYGSAYPELVSSSQPWAGGGALCNFSGNADGSLTVIASGLTYHAGGGYGPSQGPLAPYANNRNYYTVGLEIVYPGNQPMTDAQYNSAAVFARTVADMFGGGNIETVRGHGEVNGVGYEGKWDPGYVQGKMIDMNSFRAYARNAEANEVEMWDEVKLWDGNGKTSLGLELSWMPENWKTLKTKLDALDVQVKALQAAVDKLSTGTGYTLEEIAQAVVTEFKKAGN